jgi:iron complex outermembrane receptor protein
MKAQWLCSACFVAVSAISSNACLAQTEAATVPEDSEIVVTAQKREQNLNDVGMSVSVLGTEALDRAGATTPDDLARLVPGLVAAKSAYGTPVYTLRGVGFYDYSLGAVPAVSVYVDQIPLPYSQMAQFAGLDVERVEVLKGPQGTLYGLNSTGGAINYIAAKPTRELSASAALTVGSYGQVDARGYVSGPLSETLGVRLSFATEQGGNWQKSITRDEVRGAKNRTAARLLANWEPSNSFSMLVSLNYGVDKSDSLALQFLAPTPLNPQNTLLKNFRPLLYNFGAAPADPRAADWDPDTDYRQDNENIQASVSLQADVNNDITFKSLTSYQHFRARSSFDGDGTPYQAFIGDIDGKMYAFFQELALYGDMGSVNWVAGVNFIADGVNQYQLGFYPYSFGSLVTADPAVNESNQDARTGAIFGNIEYALNDQITLQAGLRYTTSKRNFQGCTLTPTAATAAQMSPLIGFPLEAGDCITIGFDDRPHIITASLKEDNIAWRVGANWKFADNGLLYANISHGYKGGAFPLLTASREVQLRPVTQEDLVAYEIGAKIGIDRWLQFNAALFWYDYTDKQIRGRYIDVVGALSALVNVPKSRIKGAEAQLILRPVTGLMLSVDGTYLSSRILGNYSNYDFIGQFQLLSGEDLPFTPHFIANAGGNYRFGIGGGLAAEAGFNLAHRCASNAGLGELALARIDASTTLDLSASIGADDDSWRLRVWGKNVTNEYQWSAVTLIIDTIARNPLPGRTIGATVEVRF